jgi:glutamine amidotransferase
MIAIIDYGLGNLGSIQNMLNKIGYTNVIITKNEEEINSANKIILPGVGAFDNGMKKINESGLLDVLNDNVIHRGKPILGICLGMQLMTKGSEEGILSGLGWIDAYSVKFNYKEISKEFKIPHMGWNEVEILKHSSIIANLPSPSRFYFVHSYYVKCYNFNDELLSSNYGIDFCCAFQHNNILGVQFHPEKSHKFGMQILQNYCNL